MTREELDQQIERAVDGFSSIEGLEESVAERLVGEGFLSYDDLSVIEPDDLMEMGELSAEAVDMIVNEAENRATVAEVAAADERRKQREQGHVEPGAVEANADSSVENASKAGEEVQEQEATSQGELLDAEIASGEASEQEHVEPGSVEANADSSVENASEAGEEVQEQEATSQGEPMDAEIASGEASEASTPPQSGS
jgi:N utilization substance protein A